MNIDLQTLSISLSITNILQMIALFAQYRMDKNHRGLGWWVLGGAAGAVAFAFNYLRDTPVFGPAAVVANNVLFVSGLVFPYIGVRHFFNLPSRRKWLGIFYVVFGLGTVYFTYFEDSVVARRVLTSAAIALFSFFVAYTFFVYKSRAIATSANFLTGVFLVNSGFFGVRAVATLSGGVIEQAFAPSLAQTALYLAILVGSMLWTLGFITLINQHSNAEAFAAQVEAERLVHELKLADAERSASEKHYRLLAEHANDVIWTINAAGQFTYVSPSIMTLRGFTPEEALVQTLEEAFCLGSRSVIHKLLNDARQRPIHAPLVSEYVEVEQPRKDGSAIWTEVTARAVYDSSGQFIEWVCVSRDIAERKQLQEDLQQQAATDELTGIANRRYFMQTGSSELSRAVRTQRPLALAILDVDHFKYFNDTYGHADGDRVLQKFAQVCQRNIREIDLVARLGGDEFVLLFPETSREQARDVVERIRLALMAQPVNLGGIRVAITFSGGVAGALLDEAETFDGLLQRADRALYEAKEAGRNRVVVSEVICPSRRSGRYFDD